MEENGRGGGSGPAPTPPHQPPLTMLSLPSPAPQDAAGSGGSSGRNGGGNTDGAGGVKRKRLAATPVAVEHRSVGGVEGTAAEASAASAAASTGALVPSTPLPPVLASAGGGDGRPSKMPRRAANVGGAGDGATASAAAVAAPADAAGLGNQDARRTGRGEDCESGNGGGGRHGHGEGGEQQQQRQDNDSQEGRPAKMPRRNNSGGGITSSAGGSDAAAPAASAAPATSVPSGIAAGRGGAPAVTERHRPSSPGRSDHGPGASVSPMPYAGRARRQPAAGSGVGISRQAARHHGGANDAGLSAGLPPAAGPGEGDNAAEGAGRSGVRVPVRARPWREVTAGDGGGGGGGGDGSGGNGSDDNAGMNAVVVRDEDAAAGAAADGREGGGREAAAELSSGEEGGEVGFVAAPRAEGLTGDDFQCNICWEMLARPVTLACGHTACESCMAKYLRAQAQAQAQIGNLRANRISCPAGCQRMIPLVLPEVTTMVQKLLTRGFPSAYRERLQETEPERALVSQVRRIADDAAAESRRRRRRPHHHAHGGIGGAVGGGGAGGGLGGMAREVVGFGNVPPGFMQGLHGQQNAARFRLDVAVPQREIPPTVARWYKYMGLALFACLCVSWQYPGNTGEGLWHPSLAFWRKNNEPAVTVTTSASEHQCVTGGGAGDADSGDCSVASDGAEKGEFNGGSSEGDSGGSLAWLFSMEMDVQEYIAHNRWNALRSFHPSTNPWSGPLFLYLEDPILLTPSSSSSSGAQATPPATAATVASSSSSSSVSSKKGPRVGGGGSSVSASPPSGWLSTLAWPVTYSLRKVGVLSSPANPSQNSSGNDHGASAAAAGEAAIGKGSGGDGGGSDDDRHECDHAPVGGGGGDGGGVGEDDEVCWREGKKAPAEVSSPVESSSAESSSVESSSTDAGNSGAEGVAGEPQQQRRIFVEFFGPVVGVFAALGLPAWLSELLTVVAAQLCPLLAAMPLLRLSPQSTKGAGGDSADDRVSHNHLSLLLSSDDLVSLDFSLDLAIYTVFTLAITTATLWRFTWKSFKRNQPRSRTLKLLLTAAASHLIREVMMIKVAFPIIEHLLFHYVLQWRRRYLLTWLALSIRVFIIRLLACLRVALLMATPFVPRGLLHTLEGVWCHLFTYLLLGTRFFNTYFVGEGPRRHVGGRAARRWVRAMREARAGAARANVPMANLAAIPNLPPLPPHRAGAAAGAAAAGADAGADAAGDAGDGDGRANGNPQGGGADVG
ncbi:unnamed protein product, partial [Ectocarpus sp. 12 AP-2014]